MVLLGNDVRFRSLLKGLEFCMKTPRGHVVLVIFLAAFTVFGDRAKGAVTQQSPCDSSLPFSKDDPLAYRKRGDRCEGRYIKDVSSAALTIASFTRQFDSIKTDSPAALQIEWNNLPGNQTTRLRAQSIKHRVYYRMDALPIVNSSSYLWPVDVLAALNLGRKDIGVTATSTFRIDDDQQEVYLPLRIGYEPSIEKPTSYQLIAVPGMELQELYLSVREVGFDGQDKRTLVDGEALQYGYYPANRGIDVNVRAPDLPGLYRLELAARLKSGGATTAELWFYHAQSPVD